MAKFKSKLFPKLPQETQDQLNRMIARLKWLEQTLSEPWKNGEYKPTQTEKDNYTQEKYQLQASLYDLESKHGLTEEAKAWAYQFFPKGMVFNGK